MQVVVWGGYKQGGTESEQLYCSATEFGDALPTGLIFATLDVGNNIQRVLAWHPTRVSVRDGSNAQVNGVGQSGDEVIVAITNGVVTFTSDLLGGTVTAAGVSLLRLSAQT